MPDTFDPSEARPHIRDLFETGVAAVKSGRIERAMEVVVDLYEEREYMAATIMFYGMAPLVADLADDWPWWADLLYVGGMIATYDQNNDGAIAAFKESFDYDPEREGTAAAWADALVRADRKDEAIGIVELGLKHRPDDPELVFLQRELPKVRPRRTVRLADLGLKGIPRSR